MSFREAHPMDEPSEVALEDYARVLTRSRAAEAVPAAGAPGHGARACTCAARSSRLRAATIADIEGFARSLLAGRAGGLGWS